MKNLILFLTAVFLGQSIFAHFNSFVDIDAVEYSERSREPDAKIGITFTPDSYDNKKRVAFIHSGSWIRFDNVDFDEDASFVSFKATGDYNGEIQVKLDDLNNNPIATVKVPKTGGWDNWKNIVSSVNSPTKGRHSVYLHFTKPGYDIKSFVFLKTKIGGFNSGLENAGNSCYLNSLFSIFLNFPDWRPYTVLNNEYGESFDLILKGLYNKSNFGSADKISDNDMKHLISNYLGYDKQQQDPFNDVLFFAELEQTFTELTEGRRNHNALEFLNYTVDDVNNISILKEENIKLSNLPQSYISLPMMGYASLDESYLSFFEEEISFPYDGRKDLTYKSKRSHSKIGSDYPKYLLIHLQNTDNKLNKITDKFQLPQKMNFRFSKKVKEYSLVAIVVHKGTMSIGGHYMSYILKNNQWYMHDDETVTEIKDLDQVFDSSAYNKRNNNNLYPYLLLFSRSHQ